MVGAPLVVFTHGAMVDLHERDATLPLVGTVFGTLSARYLGYVIVESLGGLFPMLSSFPLQSIPPGIAVALIFGALAAILPAQQAVRVQVVEAIRYE